MKNMKAILLSIFLILIILCGLTLFSIYNLEFRYWNKLKDLKYYDNLPVPKLTSLEVVDIMKNNKGLYSADKELFKSVEYYVYHSNKDVIRQLINNLQYEIEVKFPKDPNRIVLRTYYKGVSTKILANNSGLLTAISPVLHEELYRNAFLKNNDLMIFFIIGYIADNDMNIERPDNDPDYSKSVINNGRYYDIPFYTQDTVDRDIMSLFKIYEKYQANPMIIASIESHMAHYPGNWLSFGPDIKGTIMDILKVTKNEGAEKAFEMYKTTRIEAEKSFEKYRLIKLEH
jgi:hypothetical protein